MADEADRYRLSEAQNQEIFQKRIAPRLMAHANPVRDATAIVFGGQPGAGKSPALDATTRELELRGGSVSIIGDDLRAYHPSYARLMSKDDKTAAFYTDRDTAVWIEKSIRHSVQQHVNVVIEGTMRNKDKVAETLKLYRGNGYEVEARALAVPFILSEQGILQRYEAQKEARGSGRMTTQEAHRAAYDGLPHTLGHIENEGLADRVTLLRRGLMAIYTNELHEGQWLHPPRAQEMLNTERSRPLTIQEHREYVDGYAKLAGLLSRPERNATQEEIQRVASLWRQAEVGGGKAAVEPLDQGRATPAMRMDSPARQIESRPKKPEPER